MTKLITILSVALGLLPAAHAGQGAVSSGKETKAVVPPPPVEETCFKAGEWQLDTFAQYSVGEAGRVGLFRDHGVGGGVGLNYFFSRNIGLGFDAAWLSVKEDTAFERNNPSSEHTTLHNFTGSVIFRAPFDGSCLAPYAYLGGGFHVDGKQWASGHIGVGLEYRIVPNRFGLFVDGRWTYLGDRGGIEDLNYFSVRAGVRVIF
jgi:hypothetical protein